MTTDNIMAKVTEQFVIAPDFSPEHFAGWHLLNTLLQKQAQLSIHLQMPGSHDEQQAIIANKSPALIYANPFDAAYLIREQGYQAIAKPMDKADEMAIVAANTSNINALDDLQAGCRIAMADNRDVKLIGMRLLEAVDLTEDDVHFLLTDNYQAAARQLLKNQVDVAFFMLDTYYGLSKFTKAQLTPLIESDIGVISHVLLVKEQWEHGNTIRNIVLSLTDTAEGQRVLDELGMAKGFVQMSREEAEFMIDLMNTLLD